MVPAISLEDHFISEALYGSPSVSSLGLHMFPSQVATKLRDIREGRVIDLNYGGISLQVISSVPCLETPEVCRRTNLQIAESVRDFPTRFRGFACLPMTDPKAACTEFEYCVKELKFLGALIPNHANGIFYDAEQYLPFWKQVEELDTLIYIHPTPPDPTHAQFYQGNYPKDLGMILGMHVWGWHADIGSHLLRLFFSGLFDKVPKLKIVLGHMGEMLPFMKGRIQYAASQNWLKFRRGWNQVWDENLWFTTSMFDMTAMACLVRSTSIDRIMYSVDYPLVSMDDGVQFIDKLRQSGLLTEEEFEKVLYKNAQKLLGINVEGC
jgi:predicted TIM-barrel fold metal-dependent hydrolase